MKIIFLTFIVFISTLFVLPVRADSGFNGNYLYQAYRDYDRNIASRDSFAYMGYVRGVAAMMIAEKKMCVDDDFAFSQAFDAVGNYLKQHPKSRSEIPVLAVVISLETEFPCSKSS
ncbi:MAG: Rap1a/Tai family immunity protein [Hafnia alvei]|uniref:Rap1a immunity protein domain-containing protein n=1 Tax=Hafnia alvei TaxID=569 RepID=A0ABD7Q6N9_HAFAL|nr:Rap1a/Tai family immunity protein [Hafnia alvei]NEY27162.1 hypothetical protein [Escherichia coli]TBL66386.1 hypothetical protein EYY96_15485 [Hafnia alvei]